MTFRIPWLLALLTLGNPVPVGASEQPAAEQAAGTQTGKRADKAGPRLLQLQEQLNLTDEQTRAIEAVHLEMKGAFEQNRRKMGEQRKALRDLLRQGFNEKEVQRLAAEQGRLYAERIELRSRRQSRVMDLLSEQQRVRLRALVREKLRERRQHRQRDPDAKAGSNQESVP